MRVRRHTARTTWTSFATSHDTRSAWLRCAIELWFWSIVERTMWLSTVGHATLAIKSAPAAAPVLITDPWILGSCYWRSWWLERYPSPEQVADLGRARFCYLTHEHPDHFHPPSLRRLGPGPLFLVPAFSRDAMGAYLRNRGFRAETITAGTWRTLMDDVRVASVPTLGNDSILLIDTPEAFIANLNDARPTPDQMVALRWMRKRAGRGKPCIVLASYSSAGIGNSIYKGGERLSFVGGGRHLEYVNTLCRVLDAQSYVPFASHVVFERPDTRWANDFRVSVEEVRAYLEGTSVHVLPPYVTLDLATGAFTSEHAGPLRREERISERVQAQLGVEAAAQGLTDDELGMLARKLGAAGRGWLPLLCPRGVGLVLGEQRIAYDPFRARVVPMRRRCSITLKAPVQAVKDVLASGFFSDLCIPMFTDVELAPEVSPIGVYVFFTMIQLHDQGATSSPSAFARWMRYLVRDRIGTFRAALRDRGAMAPPPMERPARLSARSGRRGRTGGRWSGARPDRPARS
jgi:hypothetical protein